MEELSLTLIYEDLTYFSDSIICSIDERKSYVSKIRDIMTSETDVLYFNSGEDVHFFSNGILKQSIVTITIRPINDMKYVENRRQSID